MNICPVSNFYNVLKLLTRQLFLFNFPSKELKKCKKRALNKNFAIDTSLALFLKKVSGALGPLA